MKFHDLALLVENDQPSIFTPRRLGDRLERVQMMINAKIRESQKTGDLILSGMLVPQGSLPDNFTVNNLMLDECSGITQLPKGLHVKGDLTVSASEIKVLPEDLIVGGTLDISYTLIKTVPSKWTEINGSFLAMEGNFNSFNNLKRINGDLQVDFSNVISTPPGFKVTSNASFVGSLISKIGPGLQVVRDCLFEECGGLKSLSPKMVIGGSLHLYDTEISALPKDLIVGGSIDITSTPLERRAKTWTQIHKMYPSFRFLR